jgi:fructokinase
VSAGPRFLVAGEALFDVFVGEERNGATLMEARAGGSPFNVAIGLARLGCSVAFHGGISTDTLGDRLVKQLAREGVDVSLVRRLPKRTTLSLVGLSPQGVPAYSFYGAGSADAALDPADLPTLPDTIRAIHVGSYATVIQPIGASIAELVAREYGSRIVSYDPNVRPTIEPDLDLWRTTVDRIARQAHILKISAEDFGLLYQDEKPEQRAAAWLDGGVKLAVLTSGSEGARAWTAAGAVAVEGVAVSVVDTIGAGDSFQAALLAALDWQGGLDRDAIPSMGLSTVKTILAHANRAAAIACTRRGADLPRQDELR